MLGLEPLYPVSVVIGIEARLQAWEASILSTTFSTHLHDHFKRIFKQTKLNKVFLIFFTFTSQLSESLFDVKLLVVPNPQNSVCQHTAVLKHFLAYYLRAWGCNSEQEFLPIMLEALGPIPNTAKQNKTGGHEALPDPLNNPQS